MIRLNLYSDYLKQTFGEKVQKISIDAGLTCPNRDGSKGFGGCTFCNNDSFSMMEGKKSISDQVSSGVNYYKSRNPRLKKFLAYFQSYTNTYAELDHLKKIYAEALAHPEIVGLVIGTRPDCIDKKKIEYLESLTDQYDITIEYGVESVNDETLKKINRGHSFYDFQKAIDITYKTKIKMGTHLIFGFPWESADEMIESTKIIANYPLQFIKFHQLHIVKDTVLGNQYIKSPFHTLTKNEYMDVLKVAIEYLPKEFVIQRLFGNAPKELMLSPHWPESIANLMQEFTNILENENRNQGKFQAYTT